MGRTAPNDFRELIIGRDARGYVTPHHYVADSHMVFALAIRCQREAGYKYP